MCFWLWLQWAAWARGHTSAFGRLFGLYLVYEDRQYNEHLQVASAPQVTNEDIKYLERHLHWVLQTRSALGPRVTAAHLWTIWHVLQGMYLRSSDLCILCTLPSPDRTQLRCRDRVPRVHASAWGVRVLPGQDLGPLPGV